MAVSCPCGVRLSALTALDPSNLRRHRERNPAHAIWIEGAKLSDATKLYADVGYTTAGCTGCEDAINLGAGVEHKLSGNVYGKLAYRHYFIGNSFSDSDAVVAGVGFKF